MSCIKLGLIRNIFNFKGRLRMKKSTVFFLIGIFALSITGVAQAASPWTEGKTWHEKALGKLDFGFKNLLGGWTAVFSETAKANKAEGGENKALSVTKGLGRGLAYGLVDTVGGILHVVTFPIVQLDVPLPENGVNLD